MQESHSTRSAGGLVVMRDERWAVVHAERFDSTTLLKLRGVDRQNRDEVTCALTPFDEVTPIRVSSRVRQGSRHAVLAKAVDAVASAMPWDECWTAARARIDLHAWQLEPAIAAVRGAARILLADAVGLGKTIQAGLIVAELAARGLAERVLILTPAALREQWRDELGSRFALSAVVFDQAHLASAAASLPPYINPWRAAPIIISSIDLVKRPEVRVALGGSPFDVLIIDEAHHLTSRSDRGAVARDLAARTPWVVLASATPHSGDAAAYLHLTGIGATPGSRLTIFKRSPPDALRQLRRSRLLYVTPTGAERALLEHTQAYLQALSRERHGPGRLIGSIIARRAASSAAAAALTVSRRLALLATPSITEQQVALPWLDDNVGDDVDDATLAGVGLTDAGREIEWLHQLGGLAAAASDESSKLRVIRRLLRRTSESILVFSEYRDVVMQIASGLADMCSVAVLHGGQPARERGAAAEAFNAGRVRVLVATDAAGEGLNLQARCRMVVNLELPWTPLKLEQRVGRVDRIGQTRRVHALHLAHRGSYEGTVITRLERRRQAALSPVERARSGDTAAGWQRRMLSAVRTTWPGTHHAAYAGRGPRGAQAPILLFRCAVTDRGGQVVQHTLVAIRVKASTSRRLTRRHVREWLRHSALQAAIRVAADQQAIAIEACTRRTAIALESRASALLEMSRGTRRHLWQGSLFDRRAEQQAAGRDSDEAMLRTHLLRRREAFHRLRRLSAGDPEFVAAWLGPR